MVSLFNRLYYCFFRLHLGIARAYEMDPDMPRTGAVLILALLLIIKAIAVLGVLSVLLGYPLLIGSTIGITILSLSIIAISFIRIFRNNRYQSIEQQIGSNWQKEKWWNVILMTFYIILTIIILLFSIYYINRHPLPS